PRFAAGDRPRAGTERPMARLRPRPLGIDARPDDRAALGRDDDGRDAVLRPGALRRGAVCPVTPDPSIIRLTRVTRIFQKNVFTKATPAARAGCRAGLFVARTRAAAAPRSRWGVLVKTATNLWLQATRAGCVLLFPDCYLQWTAQLYRARRTGAAARGRAVLRVYCHRYAAIVRTPL